MAVVRQGTLCFETCRQLVHNSNKVGSQGFWLAPRFQSRVLQLMTVAVMLLCLKQVKQETPAKVKML